MSRIRPILIIFIVGLIATQYQFFHRLQIPQSVLGSTTYQSIQKGISDVKENLSIVMEKILSSQLQVPTVETEEKQEQEIPQTTPVDRSLLTAENILYYTNIERTSRGLKPLKFNSKLTRSANGKSSDMFKNQYFAHESPIDSKKTFAYFIDSESYQFVRVSENLAMGDFTTAKDVVKAWMDSPTHRANILFADYRDIGAAVQKGTLKGSQTVMIVQHFGIPKTACPSISTSIQKSLETIEQEALLSKKEASELEDKMNQKGSNWSDDELNEMIGVYNTTIRKYNELAKTFQSISREYNAQVAEYDKCIKGLN